jgi:hypothetical protein
MRTAISWPSRRGTTTELRRLRPDHRDARAQGRGDRAGVRRETPARPYAEPPPDPRDATAFYVQSLARAKKQDAQIILIKDVEGQRREHANSYGGDPVHALTDVTQTQVKYWVHLAEKENIGVGFLIRDSINVNGTQAVAWDAAATLADKINEARAVYGNNVRAVDYDSNVKRDEFASVDDWQLARVRKAVGPDVLIIPEFAGEGYESIPAVAPILFPGATTDQPFVVLKPENTRPDAKRLAQYARLLRGGAITYTCSTWDSPENAWVMAAYRSAKPKSE